MYALERAIGTLSGAGTKTGLLQMARPRDDLTLLRTAASVHEAVKTMPNPAEYYDQKAEKKESYPTASATIQGVLKDMYDTLAMNLEHAKELEATQYRTSRASRPLAPRSWPRS